MTVSCLYKFANLLKEKHVDLKEEIQTLWLKYKIKKLLAGVQAKK